MAVRGKHIPAMEITDHHGATTSTRPRSSFLRQLVVVGIVALILRGAWLALMCTQFSGHEVAHLLPDSKRYINTANYLLGWPELNDYPSYDGGSVYQTGEGSLMWNGPGYGAFLALCFSVFGSADLPVQLVQIVLSAAGCVAVALLAYVLLGSTRVSICAGLICALSLTSISLSCLVLTETLFFLLHAVGLLLMILAYRRNKLYWFVLSALLITAATYVRAVDQLWPAAFLILAVLLPRRFLGGPRRRVILNASVAFALCVSCLLVFCWRNYAQHGIFTFTTNGVIAARYYWTARTLASLVSGVNCRAMQRRMTAENISRYGPEGATIAQYYRDDMEVFQDALRRHPVPMAKRFLISVYQNTTRGSQLHSLQLPKLARTFEKLHPITHKRAGVMILGMTCLGLVLLLSSREHRGAGLILLLTYGYITGISGLTFWQGSRVCYPAQMAWAILAAVVLDRAWSLLTRRPPLARS